MFLEDQTPYPSARKTVKHPSFSLIPIHPSLRIQRIIQLSKRIIKANLEIASMIPNRCPFPNLIKVPTGMRCLDSVSKMLFLIDPLPCIRRHIARTHDGLSKSFYAMIHMRWTIKAVFLVSIDDTRDFRLVIIWSESLPNHVL